MLAEKTNEDLIAEKKQVQKELDRAISRNEDVARLYERLYEDNVSGKVTDEWFMQMETLTAPLLKELIDKIVVYETQGTGKHRTQRIVIFYQFVGYLEIPLTESEWEYYRANTRQGVAVEYISKNIPA